MMNDYIYNEQGGSIKMDNWKKGIAIGIIGLLVGGFAVGTWNAYNPNEIEVAGETVEVDVPVDYLTMNGINYTIEDISELINEVNVYEAEYNFDDKLADAKTEAIEFIKEELKDFDGEEYEFNEMEIDFEDIYTYEELENGDYVFTFKGEVEYDDDEGMEDFEVNIMYDFSKDKYRNDLI